MNVCKTKKVQITEHHVVEAADESGKGPSIGNECPTGKIKLPKGRVRHQHDKTISDDKCNCCDGQCSTQNSRLRKNARYGVGADIYVIWRCFWGYLVHEK